MKRRDFISKTVKVGIAVGTVMATSGKTMFAVGQPETNLPFDLVAVKGGEPAMMLDKALTALGGMKQFVKKGQSVVVKPNIGWDAPPERGANTNPQLVKRVVEQCLSAGAKKVFVFDRTCNNWEKCYTNSGIEKVVKEAGGQMVPGNSDSYYKEVLVPGGQKLTKVKVHQLILETDVFINVPVLKHHSGTMITISMKNLMGVVWDRWYWHENDLHRCIAEFPAFRKPDLNIVDAYLVMKRNGPRGISVEDVVAMKSLIVSPDIVAADAAATKLFGMEPDEIGYVKIAHELGMGRKDLENLRIKRISI